MPQISIVIPVYQTEQYLDRCVQSVLGQSFRDIEIILVDDGSSDRSGLICDQYAQVDCRVKVLHQSNKGLSAARNAGIKLASSPYIGFVDSDDWIHSEMYSVLYNDLINHDAQIAVCGIQKVLACPLSNATSSPPHVVVMTGIQALSNLLVSASTGGHTAWNKLYDIKLFREVQFPIGRLYEDAFTIYRLYWLCKTIVYQEARLYYYVQRKGSIMKRPFDKKTMDKLVAAEEICSFIELNYPELLKQAECFKVVSAQRIMADILQSSKQNFPEEYKQLEGILLSSDNKANPYISLRHKILLRIFRISPWLYRKIWQARLQG